MRVADETDSSRIAREWSAGKGIDYEDWNRFVLLICHGNDPCDAIIKAYQQLQTTGVVQLNVATRVIVYFCV